MQTKDAAVMCQFGHHMPNSHIFRLFIFHWSAWKPACRTVLRHGFNFCSSYLKNPVPVCQKKVNERFSRAHNHVSVGFGSCELMPKVFGGYPLWSSLIHNQCPINLQEPNYNDYWPFPTRTKTQWVTVMLFASGYSPRHAHLHTFQTPNAGSAVSSALWAAFTHTSTQALP